MAQLRTFDAVYFLCALLCIAGGAGLACSKEQGAAAEPTGMGGDDGGICKSDVECRDELFCNGDEVCNPGAAAADERGCRAGLAPCANAECDEESLTCRSTCVDLDGDGYANVFCGGDDCDDSNSDRFPGNIERCDHVDQDCDPSTVGDLDRDEDGSIDQACCNGERCGLDCDDELANVSRLAPEVCDGIDNDCNGAIDDGVLLGTYPDRDFDGFGDDGAQPEFVCQLPFGFVTRAGDCADEDVGINPSLPDICDGADNDCDESVDDEADELCALGESSALCVQEGASSASCRALICPVGFVDCDGSAENGCETDVCRDLSNCGGCGSNCLADICADGQCPIGDPPPLPSKSGVVIAAAGESAVEGATVFVIGETCSASTGFQSAADGSYTVTARDVSVVKATADGYLSTIAPLQNDVPLFGPEELAGYAAELDLDLDPSGRTGVAIIDFTPSIEPEFIVSLAHSPPRTLSGTYGGLTRAVVPNILPGTATIGIEPELFNCQYSCSGSTEATVYVEGTTIVYLRFSGCSEICTG